MRPFIVKPFQSFSGTILLPGDKSIAHRAIILGALSHGNTIIENFPVNKDCLATIAAFQKLRVKITRKDNKVIVFGKGLHGLTKPTGPIFSGDSGTTFRLLLGVFAGQPFKSELIAGRFLSRRPMLRVNAPLRLMGADIKAYSLGAEEYPPVTIRGGDLGPIVYRMPVASAQVKSAILLAALYAQGISRVIEPIATRDHTERMLKSFGADIKADHRKPNTITIRGNKELVSPKKIYIPADISSAGFFIVAALILPHSKICIRKASLNPTRMGAIRVLKRMGADIKVTKSPLRLRSGQASHQATKYEPMGDIIVKSSRLKGTLIKKEEIPSLIDELPILMVAACFAKGLTAFQGVDELRVKETDRIKSMIENLSKIGAKIQNLKAGKMENIIIEGEKPLRGKRVRSFGDHRTAMSMVVAGLAASGQTSIDDVSCIAKSFPDFLKILNTLSNK
ncbi:MAG: 3-phosphoshikimate 1-carboxyvinyltransferase [Candidatus Omnitrophica bacterium]|nr:3-phosphoshikimate 1-carboxyvinyltransferase [Candidatus Omnitrophota bacterium]